jgi:hypothetical protein
MTIKEEYTSKIMNVLNDRIIRALQNLPESVFADVVGGKAYNTLLKRQYQIATTDWDINVYSENKNFSNSASRDFVGRTIVKFTKNILDNYRFRIEVIEEYYNSQIKDIVYEINPDIFTAYNGEKYTVGHVNLITSRFGSIGIVDLVPVRSVINEAYIEIDKVNYLGLYGITNNLINLIADKKYKKKTKAKQKINNIKLAVNNNGLSCNFYRIYYKNGSKDFKSNLEDCLSKTFLGPVDNLIKTKRLYPQFNINSIDVNAHYKYYDKLPTSYKQTIKKYTDFYSDIWNSQLNHNAYFKDDLQPVDPEVNVLQNIILNAPPLSQDTIVFMVNRYLLYPNKEFSNYDFKKGQKVSFYRFISTTYNNQYNPYAFMDLFSAGVAYAITIPKGSRVLIIGKNSVYPDEKEVLLPFGSSLKINKVGVNEVTYFDQDIWYDEMTTYEATYIPEIKKSAIPHFDIPQIKNEYKFNKLLQDPQFKYQFIKMWLANKLQ